MAEGFSPAQTKLICAIVKNLKGPLEVDWEAAAIDAQLANAGSAQRSWNLLKQAKGIGGQSTPKKRKTGEGGEAERQDDASPTPKRRGRKPKANEVVANSAIAGDADTDVKSEPEDAV